MTHYSSNESHCRVDIFKPSGKWYETVAIDMGGHYNHNDIHTAVLEPLAKVKPGIQVSLQEGWIAVCNEPYHKHAHPVMLKG